MEELPLWVRNDGGRAKAGFRGSTGDCACRAISIASRCKYIDVYNYINELAKFERKSKRKRGRSNARTGVYKNTMIRAMKGMGAIWTPTMFVGKGCKVHVLASELPMGRLILNLSKHYAAFIDGVLYDTHDCARDGTRCVYGYWTFNGPNQDQGTTS